MRASLLALLFMCALLGCNGDVKTGPQPWTHLRFNNNPDEFHFAIVGDRTGRARLGVFEKGLAKLNLLRPEFVMSVGDLIEGYTKDEAEIDQQWEQIEGFVSKLEAPFFYVPGNHDLSNPVQKQDWRERFGPSHYHFVYRNVLFLAVNTSDPESRLSTEQIAYFDRVLKGNAGVRWTCVFMHEPLWDYKTQTNWGEFEKLLLDRPYTVFAGHYHTYTKFVRNDRRYLVLATTGGGMKQSQGAAQLGTFDHVTWVTMLPDGPRVANIELDAIHDEDVRTETMANLINRVLRGEVMRISPVLTRQEQFDRASASLEIVNDADVPVTARGRIAKAGALVAMPGQFELTVPARSTGKVPFELRADSPSAVEKLEPMTVNWTATYEADGKPLSMPREDVLAVDQIRLCGPRTSPVVLDGDVDEWQALPITSKGSSTDNAYQFATAHDEKHVYVAVKVTDDVSTLNPLKEPWSQDGVEIRLDARADPVRSLGRGRGEFKETLVISMSPGVTPEQMVLYNREQILAGVRAKCIKTDTGFSAEVAIPVSYFNERQGGAWKAFRLNVAVDDYDKVEGPLKAHWWRPDWRSAETFSGSGTFERK